MKDFKVGEVFTAYKDYPRHPREKHGECYDIKKGEAIKVVEMLEDSIKVSNMSLDEKSWVIMTKREFKNTVAFDKKILFKSIIDFFYGWEIVMFAEDEIIVANSENLTSSYVSIEDALKGWLGTLQEAEGSWDREIEFIQSL